MHSKVSCDWLPCYIKTTRQILEIFKLDGYFPDSLRTSVTGHKEGTVSFLQRKQLPRSIAKSTVSLPVLIRDYRIVRVKQFEVMKVPDPAEGTRLRRYIGNHLPVYTM